MDHPENVISICSGIGGLDLGLSIALPRLRVVTYVEREGPAAASLVALIEAGALDWAPLWTDLRTFDGRSYRGLVSGVIGGYPCQGESVAGKQRGVDDHRWLWPEVARIVGECRPRWCFFENVANHANKGFRIVGPELEAMGYRVEAGVFSAEEVGATHRRERLFILAVADGYSAGFAGLRSTWLPTHQGRSTELADADGCGGEDSTVADSGRFSASGSEWSSGGRRRVASAGSSFDESVADADSALLEQSGWSCGSSRAGETFAQYDESEFSDLDITACPDEPGRWHVGDGWDICTTIGGLESIRKELAEPEAKRLSTPLSGGSGDQIETQSRVGAVVDSPCESERESEHSASAIAREVAWEDSVGGCDPMGHSKSIGRGEGQSESTVHSWRDSTSSTGGSVGDSNLPRLEGRQRPLFHSRDELSSWPPGPQDYAGWSAVVASGRLDLLPALPEPALRGVAHGLTGRVDRLRAEGNGVVPLQAAFAITVLGRRFGWFR